MYNCEGMENFKLVPVPRKLLTSYFWCFSRDLYQRIPEISDFLSYSCSLITSTSICFNRSENQKREICFHGCVGVNYWSSLYPHSHSHPHIPYLHTNTRLNNYTREYQGKILARLKLMDFMLSYSQSIKMLLIMISNEFL